VNDKRRYLLLAVLAGLVAAVFLVLAVSAGSPLRRVLDVGCFVGFGLFAAVFVSAARRERD
jgi:hypothetical protein